MDLRAITRREGLEVLVEGIKSLAPFAKKIRGEEYSGGDWFLDILKTGFLVGGGIELIQNPEIFGGVHRLDELSFLVFCAAASAPHFYERIKQKIENAGAYIQKLDNANSLNTLQKIILTFDKVMEDKITIGLFLSPWICREVYKNFRINYEELFEYFEKYVGPNPSSPQHFLAGIGVTRMFKQVCTHWARVNGTYTKKFEKRLREYSLVTCLIATLGWEGIESFLPSPYEQYRLDTVFDIVASMFGGAIAAYPKLFNKDTQLD